MTQNKKQQKSVTIATFVAVIGVAVLMIFTFLGHAFLSGGEIVTDILIAVGVGAITIFLLWFLIKARKAENDLEKWRIFEYASLIVFVIFAITTGYFCGLGHYFTVQANKEDIKQKANEDFDNINGMFRQYYAFETEAIDHTTEGLKNAVRPSSTRTQALNEFIEEEGFEPSIAGIKAYKKKKERKLIGLDYQNYRASDSTELADIQNIISSWAMIKIPFQADRMEKLSKEISKNLTTLSKEANLPKVERNENGHYTKKQNQETEILLPQELKFKKSLGEVSGLGIFALLMLIVIYLAILFPYFTTQRTRVLRNRNYENDGGIIL